MQLIAHIDSTSRLEYLYSVEFWSRVQMGIIIILLAVGLVQMFRIVSEWRREQRSHRPVEMVDHLKRVKDPRI